MTKNVIPKDYWSGEGRKIIVVPLQILIKRRAQIGIMNGLYLTEIGYYPKATKHYTNRTAGSPDNILIHCINGEGWLKIDGQTHFVMANTFFIIPQNIPHEYGASEKDPWTIYWLKFGGEALTVLNNTKCTQQACTPLVFTYKLESIAIFENIFLTLEQGYSLEYLVYVDMLLINLLTLFLFQHGPVIRKETTDPHDFIVQKAIGSMKLNLGGSIVISKLAEESGCSVSHLSNIFKRITGHSPIDYFNHLKIQKACQYLHTENKLIKEIAAELGYSDQYYFSRIFSQLMGASPREYRARHTIKKYDDNHK